MKNWKLFLVGLVVGLGAYSSKAQAEYPMPYNPGYKVGVRVSVVPPPMPMPYSSCSHGCGTVAPMPMPYPPPIYPRPYCQTSVNPYSYGGYGCMPYPYMRPYPRKFTSFNFRYGPLAFGWANGSAGY